MLSSAVYRRLPLVYLADDAHLKNRPSLTCTGATCSAASPSRSPARDIAERESPFVTITFGLCAGQNGSLAVRSDLLIATPEARLGGLGGSPEGIADVVCDDDSSAVAGARRFLTTVPEELDTPLTPLSEAPVQPSLVLTDEDMYATPREQFDAIFDAEGAVLLGPDDGNVPGRTGPDRGLSGRLRPHRRGGAGGAHDRRHQANRPRRILERRLPGALRLDPGHAGL